MGIKCNKKPVITVVAVIWCIFQLYIGFFGVLAPMEQRPVHVAFALILTYLTKPISKKLDPEKLYIDQIVAVLLSVVFAVYMYTHAMELSLNIGMYTQFEVILAAIVLILVIEACRRLTGVGLIAIGIVFLIYAYVGPYMPNAIRHPGASLTKIFTFSALTTESIFGTCIDCCVTFIFLFVLYAKMLEKTGGGQVFIDVACSLVGHVRGGPAKVAVVASGLFGSISGSAVANVVGTGTFTIPLMKKIGYKAEFAGAVEAVASSGGQFMPPIMGAAAFIMAEMTGYDYSKIIVRAILPAFLYFLGIFLGVHFKAKKLGLKGLPKEELPKWKVLLPKMYLLLPLVLLVYMIIGGQTMAKSAIYATIACIIVSLVNKDNRMTPSKFVDALESGGKNTLSIGIACGVAGIISVCITMTGLGVKLITYIVRLADGQLIIALLLTMVCCIILGMGVPTTANYIIMASTCAPILINGMHMHVLAANMFVFYFGIVADITPPVALAAYAGSAIAKAPPMKTAFNATRLAIAAFIIPYIFAYNNEMIFVGDNVTVWSVVSITVSATLGMLAIAAGLMGYLIRDTKMIARIALVAGGLLMVIPGTVTDLAGLAILVAIFLLEKAENARDKKLAA